VLNYLKVSVKQFLHDLPNWIQFQTHMCNYQKKKEPVGWDYTFAPRKSRVRHQHSTGNAAQLKQRGPKYTPRLGEAALDTLG